MKDRILDINPDINIKAIREVYNKDTSENILCEDYDYVVDAIDMVTSKIHLIETCKKKGLEIISSMGMGNKLDPTKIEVTDIHKTTICPLAKVMRKELKDRRIKKLKVVYSTEQPEELKKKILNGKKVTPGSISFVPSVGGLIIASVVVNDLLNKKKNRLYSTSYLIFIIFSCKYCYYHRYKILYLLIISVLYVNNIIFI